MLRHYFGKIRVELKIVTGHKDTFPNEMSKDSTDPTSVKNFIQVQGSKNFFSHTSPGCLSVIVKIGYKNFVGQAIVYKNYTDPFFLLIVIHEKARFQHSK